MTELMRRIVTHIPINVLRVGRTEQTTKRSGHSTVYDGTGALRLTVLIPAVSGAGPCVPTGVVFNPGAKASVPGGFVDPTIPAAFHPFNVMNIQGNLYVTYALCCEANSDDEVHGPGLGYVDVFDTDGNLIRRVAIRGKLNAPWGVALAPAGFGRFSNDLLVGTFGDGRINAYDPDEFSFADSCACRTASP